MNKLFYIETYGCKLNQLDSERLRDAFYSAGYSETDNPAIAEILIINSCAVTGNAEKESRYRLRRLRRINPDAQKYFIGCFTETQTVSDTVFLRGTEKFRIRELSAHIPPYPAVQEKHVRPLIHIQNGCDLNCSYCIVPHFRGPSRSVPKADVLRQIKVAEHAGRKEGVLTGIHLGTWGQDLYPKEHFIDLLQFIEKSIESEFKIRISSLDSNEISKELIFFFRDSKLIQPHFHIPLQSGSSEILKRMKRRYTPDQYRKVIQEINSLLPEACLGADVIVGFPGETERNFEETYRFISGLPLHYLHVFPFSPRSGTPAASMPEQIPDKIKKERVQRLKTLSDRKRKEFSRRFLGKARPGILIYPDLVLTDNYLSVHLENPAPREPGNEVHVKISEVTQKNNVMGVLV